MSPALLTLEWAKSIFTTGRILGLTRFLARDLKQLVLTKGVVQNLVPLSREVLHVPFFQFVVHELW